MVKKVQNLNYIDSFENNLFKLTPVIDIKNVQQYKNQLKDGLLLTHLLRIKDTSILSDNTGVIIESTTTLEDIQLLLTLINTKYVFIEDASNHLLTHINNNRFEYNLLLNSELNDYLEISLKNLNDKEFKYLNVFRDTFNQLIFCKYNSPYIDIGQILLMQTFESFLSSYYLVGNQSCNIEKVDWQNKFKHTITEGMQLGMYKKSELQSLNVKNRKISKFESEFRKVRNWVMHGRQDKFPFEYGSTDTNQNQYHFFRKLEALIRISLIEIIYGKDYERKFKIFTNIILDNNGYSSFHEFNQLCL